MLKMLDDEADDTHVLTYRYDGLSRRIRKYTDKSGDDWTVREFYYNSSWQVVEVRKDVKSRASEPALATLLYEQYVWGLRYIDAPVCRDEDKNSDGDCIDPKTDPDPAENEGDEHLYYCQDANFNTTALVDGYDGAVVERYMYDPYGKVSVRHGVRDAAGNDTSESEWDERTSNTFDNEILYCGYRYDSETGLYHVRYRVYHPTVGCWLTRDPLGYVDGMSLYEYVGGQPQGHVDPQGQFREYVCCTEEQITILKGDEVLAAAHVTDLQNKITLALVSPQAADKYPPFTEYKLERAHHYLWKAGDAIEHKKAKCEKPGDSRLCEGGAIAWQKWIFGQTVHLCPVYFGGRYGPKNRSAVLVHEGTHFAGTLDVTYFDGEWPHDVGLTGWQDIASTYDTWILCGFCIPGYNCFGEPPDVDESE